MVGRQWQVQPLQVWRDYKVGHGDVTQARNLEFVPASCSLIGHLGMPQAWIGAHIYRPLSGSGISFKWHFYP
jgi:hypothetical protein